MFKLFTRPRRRSTASRPRRPRLQVEALEGRDCPAGTSGLSLTLLATPQNGTTVLLSGHEYTANVGPTTTTVTISGVMSGTVTPNANGDFSFLGLFGGSFLISSLQSCRVIGT